jgi:hypothetical protein
MFDLEYIVARNDKVALRELKTNRPVKGSNQGLVKTLHLFLTLDMKTANYDLVLRTCEQMMDVAFEFAPQAIEALYKKTGKFPAAPTQKIQKGEHHAVEK